jgi:colicin import membrane protein
MEVITGTKVAEYSQTEAALTELRSRHAGATFAVATKDGMKLAKAARAELRTLRVALEAKRVEIKAPVLKQANLIDTEAKRITRELEALEDPIDAQIKAEEKRIEEARIAAERAEAERVGAINKRLLALETLPASLVGRPLTEIAAGMTKLGEEKVAEWAQEFTPRALEILGEAYGKVQAMHAAAVTAAAEAQRQAEERAKLEAERAELARQQAEAAAKAKAEQEARDAEERERRRRIEEEERASRARIEAEERTRRAALEEEERKAKAAREAEEARIKAEREKLEAEQRRQREEEEKRARAARLLQEERDREERRKAEEAEAALRAKARAEQEAREAAEREERRKVAELLDARGLLAEFKERFGHLPQFAGVVAAIDALPADLKIAA